MKSLIRLGLLALALLLGALPVIAGTTVNGATLAAVLIVVGVTVEAIRSERPVSS